MFRGLALYFDDIARLLAKAGGGGAALEYLVVVLAILNAAKGPLILLGLVLWRVKWGTISNDVAGVSAFGVGVFTLFDWTVWEFSVVRILAALFVGVIFFQLYQLMVKRIESKAT